MLVRMWLFTPRPGDYPEGGTYDTSVLDTETGNCYDPHQEIYFEQLLQYSIANGEQLQEVSSAEEAYTLCSRARVNSSPTACGGGYTNESTLVSAITRPVSACGVIPVGGGSRSAPPQPCPPGEPTIPPENFSPPMVQTQTDHARRVIALARLNKIVPTVNY